MQEDRPSDTARIVALNIAVMAARPSAARLVPPEAAALVARLLRAGWPALAPWIDRFPRPWFQRLFDAYEACTVPGMALHQALRKRYLEDTVSRALDGGARQVVVLGVGLDTLAMRLARRHPDAAFLELDHPATQALKRRALAEPRKGEAGDGGAGDTAPPSNLALVSVDFNRTAAAECLLAQPGFRPGARTVVVCEGVLMYLDGRAVDGLFAGLAALPCPSLRFAFTYMEPGPGGRIAFRGSTPLVAAWLRWRGERFTWGLAEGALGGFLARRGFIPAETADAAALRARYLPGDGVSRIAEGEKIAVADAVRPAPHLYSAGIISSSPPALR